MKSSSLSFTSKSDAVCVPNISWYCHCLLGIPLSLFVFQSIYFPFGTDRDSHNHSFKCFLSSNILMLLSFREQTEYQNILRNCLKCFGKKQKMPFFPNQKETFQHFLINIVNFLALKLNKEKYIEGHMKLQQPVMLKCLIGAVILEPSLLSKG